MAGMTTVLTEFADNGNSRTYTLAGHTAVKPQLLIQKRRVPSGQQKVAEDSVFIMSATVDVDGLPIVERTSIEIIVRRSIYGAPADLATVKAAAVDIIASDEFTSMVNTQGFL